MNRDTAEIIGRNIGVAGTVAGVSGAVGKAISKSIFPPLQKAGIVVGAGVAGGAIHVGTSAINRVVNTPYCTVTPPTTTPPTTSNLGGGVNKFVADLWDDEYSDLMLLLLSIDTLTYVCLGLILILFMMILFKFYLNESKVKLNLSSLIGYKMNNYLNHYLIRLVQLNKKTSIVYIFITFFLLFIGLSFDCYFITELYNNLEIFVCLHINARW